MEYNSQRNALVLKEYGRNIQMLVQHVKDIEDKEQRNKYVSALVDLMRQINPNSRDYNENTQKLWDDLFIIADFDLDVDTPFPMPERSILSRKPQRMNYNTNDVSFKHYGKNIELLINKAKDLENEEEKEASIVYIGRLMKSFFLTWNKDNIQNEVILKNIEKLSEGNLTMDINKINEHGLFESARRERDKDREEGRSKQRSKGKRNYKRKRN